MEKRRKTMALGILLLVFSAFFFRNVKSDLALIFKKDLLAHDESSNSVVAANIMRKFFPPMVRTNPLNEQQGNWMEGPFWQHIPPLYAYVPYPFFQLDGQVTVEVKRLSYAFVIFLTGLIFILGVYRFGKNIVATSVATLAAVLWVKSPFTHELVTGYAFGVSDIVLAFTVAASFGAVLWYLKEQKESRLNYSWQKIVAISLVVALPIMAKNLLGAIPAATFFTLLLRDYKLNSKFWIGAGSFLALSAAYYLPLFFSSPETFRAEIMVSFLHGNNYEGWGRPWHWYITNYLPQRYLMGESVVFAIGFIFSIWYMASGQLERKSKILLGLSGLWFAWNLVAVSLVESKIANFIFQSYLLSLYFVIYGPVLFVYEKIEGILPQVPDSWKQPALALILILSLLGTGFEALRLNQQLHVHRAMAYSYETEREKFYQTAEELRAMGLNSSDIVIARLSDNDCWFRYNVLFLTGAEAKALLEMNFGFEAGAVKTKYGNMHFVINKNNNFSRASGQRTELANYSLISFDLTKLSAAEIKSAIDSFTSNHRKDIDQDILRIKKDLTSCQWLVPDPILNAP